MNFWMGFILGMFCCIALELIIIFILSAIAIKDEVEYRNG
jgi:hypothetical protein